jgi:hypothetical protein
MRVSIAITANGVPREGADHKRRERRQHLGAKLKPFQLARKLQLVNKLVV